MSGTVTNIGESNFNLLTEFTDEDLYSFGLEYLQPTSSKADEVASNILEYSDESMQPPSKRQCTEKNIDVIDLTSDIIDLNDEANAQKKKLIFYASDLKDKSIFTLKIYVINHIYNQYKKEIQQIRTSVSPGLPALSKYSPNNLLFTYHNNQLSCEFASSSASINRFLPKHDKSTDKKTDIYILGKIFIEILGDEINQSADLKSLLKEMTQDDKYIRISSSEFYESFEEIIKKVANSAKKQPKNFFYNILYPKPISVVNTYPTYLSEEHATPVLYSGLDVIKQCDLILKLQVIKRIKEKYTDCYNACNNNTIGIQRLYSLIPENISISKINGIVAIQEIDEDVGRIKVERMKLYLPPEALTINNTINHSEIKRIAFDMYVLGSIFHKILESENGQEQSRITLAAVNDLRTLVNKMMHQNRKKRTEFRTFNPTFEFIFKELKI